MVSTHKRIARKLSRGPYNRRWFALVWAENLSRNQGPHGAHIRALGALSELPESARPDLWKFSLDRARATLADYEVREGYPPSAEMTFRELEEAVQKGSLASLITAPQPRGMFGTRRSEEHTSEIQSLMRISYAVLCLKKKKMQKYNTP